MLTIHTILQGKGGVGKSNVAIQLAQYFMGKGIDIRCFDTDPVNATFASYKSFNVNIVNLMCNQGIDISLFDPLIEELLVLDSVTNDEMNQHIIIDNGASTFIPFCGYLTENPVFHLLKESGIRLFMHTILTGGALEDTLTGLNSLYKAFPDIPIVVWHNHYFGSLVKDGIKLEDLPIYKRHYEKFKNRIVQIPFYNKDTYGKDFERMLTNRQTYEEVMQDSSWGIMAKQRTKVIKNNMAKELDKIDLISW